jgi:Domain of unknown function (DUF5615)
LSLNLYLDDCAYAKTLVQLLRAAGHRVVTPTDAGTSGKADEEHLQYAASQGLILITKNPDDFAQLHEASSDHAGRLAESDLPASPAAAESTARAVGCLNYWQGQRTIVALTDTI